MLCIIAILALGMPFNLAHGQDMSWKQNGYSLLMQLLIVAVPHTC